MDASLPSQDGEHLNTEPVLGVRGCLSPASVSLCYTFPGISSTPLSLLCFLPDQQAKIKCEWLLPRVANHNHHRTGTWVPLEPGISISDIQICILEGAAELSDRPG